MDLHPGYQIDKKIMIFWNLAHTQRSLQYINKCLEVCVTLLAVQGNLFAIERLGVSLAACSIIKIMISSTAIQKGISSSEMGDDILIK